MDSDAKVELEVACNWDNVLTGPSGVARVFGPQKGADEATVARLEEALERYAEVIARDLGVSERTVARRIARLQQTMAARSRFQLGLQAERRGLV